MFLYIYEFLLLHLCFVHKSGMSSCPGTDVSCASCGSVQVTAVGAGPKAVLQKVKEQQ